MKTILGKVNHEYLTSLMHAAARQSSSIKAASPYATRAPFFDLVKQLNFKITYYGLFDAQGSVAVPVFQLLKSMGRSRAECRCLTDYFHAKVIWWEGFGAYIGSANFTNNGWVNNREAGVFLSEEELETTGTGAELELLFEELHEQSFELLDEDLAKLEQLNPPKKELQLAEQKLNDRFEQLFPNLKKARGLNDETRKPLPKGGLARQRFVQEWSDTLQTIRDLTKEAENIRLRPTWVEANAHPTLHFDQFLHAYYFSYVRKVGVDEDDDARSTQEQVARFYEKNHVDRGGAFREAIRWWAALPSAPNGEDEFIAELAPSTMHSLSLNALEVMTQASFAESMSHVNAFRMHARQMKNSIFGLPTGHKESMEARMNHFAEYLWNQTSEGGKTVVEILKYVIWGDGDAADRIWTATMDTEWRMPHLKKSTLGEAIGWARPDLYPPRNNRTNKALRALGYDVKLFGNG